MKLAFCVACGSTEDLQHHHFVAHAEGGSDDESNLITLCCGCHLKLHERQRNETYNASQLRQGVAGLPRNADARAQQLSKILAEFNGQSANATAKALNARGLPTARGGKWTGRSIIDVRARGGHQSSLHPNSRSGHGRTRI
jgi:HNH endonuclease